MGRKKIEFTDNINFRISQLVEVNKSVREIKEDLSENFNFNIGETALRAQVKSLGYNVDCRTFNGNHSRGYSTSVVSSKSKPISKYKLKKMDDDNIMSRDDAKKIGYDKYNNPLNFKLVVDSKTNVLEEVELSITVDDIKYNGGEEIRKLSDRWWNIQRMRFDMGDKSHPLLTGQKRGDWRGVVHRFNFDENDYYRFGEVDIIKEQQDAWERYVDAVYDATSQSSFSKHDIINANKFIISGFNDKQMNEMITNAPEMIYEYIPTYLYNSIIKYCVDKMYEDRRVETDKEYDTLNNIKKVMYNARSSELTHELHKIDLDVVKKCLYEHPNDYDLVIKYCCVYAMKYNMIDRKYFDFLRNMLSQIKIKSIEDKYTLNGLGWFAMTGVHIDDFMNCFNKRDNDMKVFCKKYGLMVA